MHSSCIFQNFFYLSLKKYSYIIQGRLTVQSQWSSKRQPQPPSSTARVSGTCSNGLNANSQRGFDVDRDQGALGCYIWMSSGMHSAHEIFLATVKITCSSSVATKMPTKFLQAFFGSSFFGSTMMYEHHISKVSASFIRRAALKS